MNLQAKSPSVEAVISNQQFLWTREDGLLAPEVVAVTLALTGRLAREVEGSASRATREHFHGVPMVTVETIHGGRAGVAAQGGEEVEAVFEALAREGLLQGEVLRAAEGRARVHGREAGFERFIRDAQQIGRASCRERG